MDADRLPSNSREQKRDRPQRGGAKKEIKKVVEGRVVRRKKSLGRRVREIFIGGSARSVWGFVWLEVLIPAAQDMFVEAVNQGTERMVYRDERPRRRRGGFGGGSSGGPFINYQNMSRDPRERDRGSQMTRRGRRTHNFDEIILESRHEAEEVMDQLFRIVDEYQCATVADLYNLVDIDPEWTDDKWGWTDISGAGPTRVSGGGYLLELPRPEPLD